MVTMPSLAAQIIVLLKNEDKILSLVLESLSKVTIISGNAKATVLFRQPQTFLRQSV
jgi:hypothetical protein